MAESKAKSVLIGFSTCPLCGGKTHVKRIDAPSKRAYSHCLDERDLGCSHTHYSTNAAQEGLMLGKMRPAGTPAPAPAPAAEARQTHAEEGAAAPAPARRRGLFG